MDVIDEHKEEVNVANASQDDTTTPFEFNNTEEEEEEDGEYRLQFHGRMDPMELVDVNAFGLEPYQQFQRLEYEALAEKKRKAPQLHNRMKLAKKNNDDDVFGAQFDEILNSMTHHRRRRRRGETKKRGRKRGSKRNINPEVTKKLGHATLHYASGHYEEAIHLLEEVVKVAPNLADAYHTLGLIYNDTGDKKKAMNFYMIAAHLTPKDPSLWKLLVSWSIEEGNTGLVKYCLSKAIRADPKDIDLRLSHASLYVGLGDYQKAAESYEQIIALYPANVDILKIAAKMYKKCGHIQKAIFILESYLDSSLKVDFGVLDLLLRLHMENGAHGEAIKAIEHAHSRGFSDKEMPLNLLVKEAICHAYLGDMDKSEILLRCLYRNPVEYNGDLIIEVADSFSILGFYDTALKYYFLLKGTSHENGTLHYKISQCYLHLNNEVEAMFFLHKVLSSVESNIDARITLSSILNEKGRANEAIVLLSPPENSGTIAGDHPIIESKPWWLDGRVRMTLSKVYYGRGMIREFVDTLFPCVQESLFIESLNEEVPVKRRLNMKDLHERVKLLDDHDNIVLRGLKPIATSSEMTKALRAKKLLQKRTALKEERKARTLASGFEWQSEDSEEDSPPKELREPPIPNILKDGERYQLIIDLCKALVSLQRYWDALEVMNHALKFAKKTVPCEKMEELRSIGAQIACNATDPVHGYDFVRSIVMKYPNSYAAWNFYYKLILRCDSRLPKHVKFLHSMRVLEKTVFPMIIYGHQFTMNSQHQDAAREYLEARKLQPDNPLINLCVGTALINLALGHRLKNKHLTVVQGLAFLYDYLHFSNDSQEALYNIARAFHHVGLVTLAASYYEKVLTMEEKDHPIPKLSYDVSPPAEIKTTGYCSLHREAAYNLHLIYKKSGATDLARQVLKTFCST